MKFEKDILKEINTFRQNPKSIQRQIEVFGKGISRLKPNDPFLKEIDDFISTIDHIPKMPPVVLNTTLSQIAKDEAKKYSRNESSYKPFLIGNQLRGILPEGFLSQNPGLIADSGADEAQNVVPKLLLNRSDKERKGRKILCSPEYTQVGIANTEFEGENYYVIIFANKNVEIKPETKAPSKIQEKPQVQSQVQERQERQERTQIKVQEKNQIKIDRTPDQGEQGEEGEPELPNVDLNELKQAFDLYDHDGSQKINIKECINGLKLINFDKTNPILFDIVKDLEDTEWCSWPKFAFYVYNCITDRNTDEGLRTLFDLFIDDPEKETISLPTFRKICQEVGDNMSDEELKNILEITTQSGNDISFDDFCQYMKLTA